MRRAAVNRVPIRAVRVAGAFTLIEVLMATLILAIGLLGLGVVIPVVARQQRIASDQVFGTGVGQQARDLLLAQRAATDAGFSVVLRTRPLTSTGTAGAAPAPEPSFTLQVRTQAGTGTTVSLPLAASAQTITGALEALPIIGSGNVSVTRTQVGPDVALSIRLTGRLSGQGVQQVDVVPTNLDGADVYIDAPGLVSGGPAFWSAWASATPRPRTSAEVTNPPTPASGRFWIPADATWMVPPLSSAGDGAYVLGAADVQVFSSGAATNYALTPVRLPLADRLSPLEVSRGASPQFVWDLALRRRAPMHRPINTPPGSSPATPDMFPPLTPESSEVEATIFVRRLDPRIRPSGNVSLVRALIDPTVGTADRRWPLSVDNNGVPTQDGLYDGAFYSRPQTALVVYNRVNGPDGRPMRDRITLAGAGNPGNIDTIFQFMAQPGQKLVDNLGNVHTVLGPDERAPQDAYAIRLARSAPESVGFANDTSSDQLGRTQPLKQVVFTPQIPAAVILTTLNRR
jgi:Tfp pilus assembly protein PilV